MTMRDSGVPQFIVGSAGTLTTPNSGAAAARQFQLTGVSQKFELDSLGTFDIAYGTDNTVDAATAAATDKKHVSAHSQPRILQAPDGYTWVSVTASSDFTIYYEEVE